MLERLAGLAGISAVTATGTLLAVQPISFGRGAPTVFLVAVGGWLFVRGLFLAGAGLFAAADDDRPWRLWLVPLQVILGFGALYAAIWRLDPGSIVGAGLEPHLYRFSLFAATLGGAGDLAPEGVSANAAVFVEIAVAAVVAGALARRLNRPTGWIVGAVALVLAGGIVLSLGEEKRLHPGFERGIALRQATPQALHTARELGANWVSVATARAAKTARAAGFEVAMRPRGSIERLPRQAQRAQRAGVRELVMDGPARPARRWRRVIAAVRQRFKGTLTYAARPDTVDAVEFWDELDAIGIDAYYRLSHDRGVGDLTNAWRDPVDDLAKLHDRYGKDVLLTAIGYPDAEENAVEAALVVWAEPDWAAGMFWREGSTSGAAGDHIHEWYSD